MKTSKIMMSIAALVAIAMVASGSASAGTPQNWYLEHNGGLSAEKTTYTGSDLPSNVIADGSTAYYWADQAALVDVQFGSGTWTWNLDLLSCTGTYRLGVGYGNDVTNTVTSMVWVSSVVNGCTSGVNPGSVVTGDFVVPEGSTLVFMIENIRDCTPVKATPGHPAVRCPASNAMTVQEDGTSFVTSPSTDPGYPTPELGTLVLAGSGLAVAGVVVARRNK